MAAITPGQMVGPWKVARSLGFGDPALFAATGDDGTEVVLRIAKLHRMGQTWQDREVAALQSLDHPAIPRFVDAGRAPSGLYVATRPYPSETLAERLFSGPPELALACSWLHAVASALRHMHAHGWVHGDVTPQHVHVHDDGRAWLMGLAGAQRIGESPRYAGELPDRAMTHLAPEVLADPQHTPPRADIYAFGTVAYELLTGEPAFPAAAWAGRPDQQQLLLEWKTRHRELDPGDAVPDWLRALVRACTQPDAPERLPGFDAVVAWLDGSRPSWELPVSTATPMLAQRRGALPPLVLQPRLSEVRAPEPVRAHGTREPAPPLDTDGLADAIAARVGPGREAPSAELHLLVAALAGVAVGLVLAVMFIVYVELRQVV